MNNRQFTAVILTVIAHFVLFFFAYLWHVDGEGVNEYSVKVSLQTPEPETEEVEKDHEQPKPRKDRWNHLDEANTNEAYNEALNRLSPAQREAFESQMEQELLDVAQAESKTGLYKNKYKPSQNAPNTEGQEGQPNVESGDQDKGNTSSDKTNISYFLKDRKHLYGGLKNPVYLCEEGGVVKVTIHVSPAGLVTKASVLRNESSTAPCLQEAALQAAKKSRFEAGDVQQGWIRYQFVAQ